MAWRWHEPPAFLTRGQAVPRVPHAIARRWAIGIDWAAPGTDRTTYVTLPHDAHEASPDDTQLSYEAWCAKVEAVLAECEARQKQIEGENPFFDV